MKFTFLVPSRKHAGSPGWWSPGSAPQDICRESCLVGFWALQRGFRLPWRVVVKSAWQRDFSFRREPTMELQLERALGEQEAEAVLAVAWLWALGDTVEREVWRVNLGVFAHIALLTGLRVSEVCRSQWGEWFPNEGYARVWCHKKRRGVSLCAAGARGRATEVFRGRLRTIPVCERLCAFLRQARRPQGDVILSEIKPGHRRRRLPLDEAALLVNKIYRIRYTWPQLLEAAGVRQVRLHDTRHTFGSRFYRKTHDIVTTSRLLGHSSLATTMVYMECDPLEQRALVNKAFG